MKEIVDESLRQLEEPDAEAEALKRAKEKRMSKGVAESFLDGVEDGSVDLSTVPETDIPAWYDAAKAKYQTWQKRAEQLEARVPEMQAEDDRATPPPFFGKKGERTKEQIAAEAIHQLSDTSDRDAKELRGAERAAEAFLEEIEKGEIDLAKIPESEIPGYHKAIKKKAELWKRAMKTLEERVQEVEADDIEDEVGRKAA